MTATAIGAYATASALKSLVNITDTTDDTLIGLICDRVNQYIETSTGRVLAPISSTTYLYDGDATRLLDLTIPVDKTPVGGIRAITLLEFQAYTGATWETVTAGDYFLRRRVGMTGPFEQLVFTDVPVGNYAYFPKGYQNVRVTGTAGWPAIPDDITELALSIAARAWNGRQMGYTDSDTNGIPVSNYITGRDKDILRRYSIMEYVG